MIGAVLFDFGGVLAEEGFSQGLQALAEAQQLTGVDLPRQGMRAVYDSGFVLGRGSAADFWALLRERTGLRGDAAELTARILDGFRVRPWMLDVVDGLRAQGYVTGILSDQTDWLDQLDAGQHFYRHFDHVFNSYYLGRGKRDRAVFDQVARDLGLPAAAILLVDDNPGNVARAGAAGLRTIHYRGRARFARSLDKALSQS